MKISSKILFLALIFPGILFAETVQKDLTYFFVPGTTENVGATGLTLIPKSENNPEGIMFFDSKSNSISDFHPSKLAENTSTAFLELTEGDATKLITSKDKEYKVSGNINFQVGALKISIYKNSTSASYITIFDERGERSIIGLLGLQFLYAKNGEQSLKLVANNLNDPIFPVYQIQKNALNINGATIGSSSIGFMKNENFECLSSKNLPIIKEKNSLVLPIVSEPWSNFVSLKPGLILDSITGQVFFVAPKHLLDYNESDVCIISNRLL